MPRVSLWYLGSNLLSRLPSIQSNLAHEPVTFTRVREEDKGFMVLRSLCCVRPTQNSVVNRTE